MKLLINYDFFNAIKDVNEDFSIQKVVRNNKRIWRFSKPMLTTMEYLINGNDFYKHLPMALSLYFSIILSLELINYKLFDDIYKEKSDKRLRELIISLKNNNIDTDYDLIKKSKISSKIYNLRINEKKIPEIIESKYILMPAYYFMNNIVDTPILQEHAIGSNKYILSIGSNLKEKRLIYQRVRRV